MSDATCPVKEVNTTPPVLRRMFEQIRRVCGLSLFGPVPKFERGVKIGETLLDEESLKRLLDASAKPVKKA
jgi:hypothetical protein